MDAEVDDEVHGKKKIMFTYFFFILIFFFGTQFWKKKLNRYDPHLKSSVPLSSPLVDQTRKRRAYMIWKWGLWGGGGGRRWAFILLFF